MPRLAMTHEQRLEHVAEQQRKAEEARAASDARVERTWRGLPPERDEAAPSAVEALMLSLRSRGIAALVEATTLHRLSELSPPQVKEVIDRLQKLRSRYSAISDGLISSILEIKK
jgi:hypothetical protein